MTSSREMSESLLVELGSADSFSRRDLGLDEEGTEIRLDEGLFAWTLSVDCVQEEAEGPLSVTVVVDVVEYCVGRGVCWPWVISMK